MKEEFCNKQLIDLIGGLCTNSHICMIYDDKTEQLETIIPIIKDGLEKGERCVYVAGDNSKSEICEALEANGISTKDYIDSTALQIRDKSLFCMQDGSFDEKNVASVFRNLISHAIQSGFTKLRLAGEMTWATNLGMKQHNLIKVEINFNRFIEMGNVISLCQYNRAEFCSSVLHEIINSHPMVIYKKRLYRNPFYYSVEQWYDEHEQPLHVERLLNNIEKHNRIHDSLVEERERFRLLMQQSPAVIELYDLDGMQIEVNRAYEKLWGFPASRTVNKFNILKSGEIQSKGLLSYIKRAYAGEYVKIPEYEFDPTGAIEANVAGRKRWLSTRIFPLKNKSGNVKNIVVTYEDISDRKYSESILRQSEERFRSIIENSDAGYFLIDKDGVFQDVNDGWLKMHKYSSREEAIGKHYLETQKPEDAEAARDFFTGIFNSDPKYMKGEFSRACKDGSVGYHTFSARPVMRDGEVIGIEGFIIDTTKNKEGEQEREHLLDLLQSKNDELQSIVYVSSHDLRNPLINIEGFSRSLADNCNRLNDLIAKEKISDEERNAIRELLSEDIPEDLLFISKGTKKMKSLIEGLLQVSRVGTVEVKMESLDMNEIIENIIANVSYRAQKIGASINFARDLPCCYGDSSQVNQLFSNLIDNAIKYLDPARNGEISIYGYRKKNKSIYHIKDNGIGIQKEHQKRIFEVYYRLNPDDKMGGEGLGLTIIKRILDRHGGSIWLESEQGKGSEFFVSMPVSNMNKE